MNWIAEGITDILGKEIVIIVTLVFAAGGLVGALTTYLIMK